MAKGLKGWVESFSTGKHPGKGALAQHTFSRDDLDQMVDNLDASNPIPHVITHDSLYSPFAFAHGIEAKREGEVLLLRSEKINPDFEKLVKSGALFERSVRIVKDAVKGFKLDHIAWLGAEPPAVQGLKAVTFSQDSDVFSEFSFIDTQTPSSLTRLARSLKNIWISKFGVEEADSAIPEHMIESMQWGETRARDEQNNQRNNDNPTNSTYSKQTGDKTVSKFTQADIDAAVAKAEKDTKTNAEAEFQKERDEQNATLAEERQERLEGEWQKLADKAIDEGRLTPAQAEGLAEFAATLPAGDDALVVSFSRNDEKGKKPKTVETSAHEWLADFVASLPKQVAMSRDTNLDDEGQEIDKTDSNAIAQKAVSYQKEQADKGLTISVSDAVAHVTKQDEKSF